jgi:TfoX/Sxy family transcriptional regulator of competence genes
MAYDQGLAQRVREILAHTTGFSEKKMFGGICCLIHGNMACGILNDDVIVRVGKDNYEDALTQPHTRIFDLTGRPMNGWIVLTPEGHASDKDLLDWVKKGVEFARSLPSK